MSKITEVVEEILKSNIIKRFTDSYYTLSENEGKQELYLEKDTVEDWLEYNLTVLYKQAYNKGNEDGYYKGRVKFIAFEEGTTVSEIKHFEERIRREERERIATQLKPLTEYLAPEEMHESSEEEYGLEGSEAIEMAYDNLKYGIERILKTLTKD